jgi:hypothetical protein
MIELISQLKEDAMDKGLCRPWQGKFKDDLNMQHLVEMYIKGIDFCIANDFPTLDFLRDNLKGKCEPFGVFIDAEVESKNVSDTVLNGECKAFLEYDGYSVSRIYARHSTKASINVSDYAVVTIDAFDKADLVVAVGGEAAVYVNLYGDAHVECIGACIRVRNMNKDTY